MTTVSGSNTISQDLINKINPPKKDNKAQDVQNNFMQLLITQLKSQDPMNPQDSTQSVMQMAQITMVSSLETLNQNMTKFLEKSGKENAMQATSMIGHSVLVKDNKTYLDRNGVLNAMVEVPEGMSKVSVAIYGNDGRVVDNIELDPFSTGKQPLQWLAPEDAPMGPYTIRASGKTTLGNSRDLQSSTFSTVTSVEIGSNGVNLQLRNGQTMPFSEVDRII